LDDASELDDTPEQSDNDIENVGLFYSPVACPLLTAL
jgi:hypothetical protein